MAVSLEDCLVIGISSRALFDLDMKTTYMKPRDYRRIVNISWRMSRKF